jgi:hypothetical protein
LVGLDDHERTATRLSNALVRLRSSRFEEIDLLELRRSLRKRCGSGDTCGPTADDRDFSVLADELLIEDGINQI